MNRYFILLLATWSLAATECSAEAVEKRSAGAAETCVACHAEGVDAHMRDLEQSAHARFGMTCGDCHARRTGRERNDAASCHAEPTEVVRMCEPCHEDVARAFRESAHYFGATDSRQLPTCASCHSNAGGAMLEGDLLTQKCNTCHGPSGVAGSTSVAEGAVELLDLLRRVSLARAIVGEQVAALEKNGTRTRVQDALKKVDATVHDMPFEWHSFNLHDVARRCRTALQLLDELHDENEITLVARSSIHTQKGSPALLAKVRKPRNPRGEGSGNRVLRFAVGAMISPRATYAAYVDLFNDLAREIGRPYQFIQRRTYQEINELLLRGEIDLAIVCSGAFAALPNDAPVDIVAVPVVNGKRVYHSLIIVNESNKSGTFQDLARSRFAFTDPLSNTGYLYPVFRLTQIGKDPRTFFSSTIFSGSHDRSILAVYRRIVDAAAVDDLVFNQLVVPGSPYWGRLRVVETSPDFAIPPLVSPTSVPRELRERMREFLLRLAETPQGRKRLTPLGIDGFTIAESESYASIRRMREATRALVR